MLTACYNNAFYVLINYITLCYVIIFTYCLSTSDCTAPDGMMRKEVVMS